MRTRVAFALCLPFLALPGCAADSADSSNSALADPSGSNSSASSVSESSAPPPAPSAPTAPSATNAGQPAQPTPIAPTPPQPAMGMVPAPNVESGGSSTTEQPSIAASGGSAGADSGLGGASGAGAAGDTSSAAGAGGMSSEGGSGGANAAGSAGTENSGGASSMTSEATPSPGCGKSGRPDGGKVYVSGESWLLFPEGYDGNTPMPVLFGFHGCGSGNRGDASRTEYSDFARNTPFASEYVVAIPLSSDGGGCWNYNADIGRVRKLYDDLVNNHCVDTSRVFATGHSSGSYFSVALLEAGHAEDAEHLNFRGMAPVAASPVNNHRTPMPVLYMENPNDTERSDNNAPTVVAGFRSANGCSESSQPYDGAESCNSSSGGARVDPGCIIYDGCSEPTIWCSHNDQSYGTTGHGIPCFAAQAMDDFFKSL